MSRHGAVYREFIFQEGETDSKWIIGQMVQESSEENSTE